MATVSLLILLSVFSVLTRTAMIDNNTKNSCNLSAYLTAEIRSYQPVVNKIIESVTYGEHKSKTYNELADFIDIFGARQAATQNLENSIDYLLLRLPKFGLENVHGEIVSIPHWVRGEETCQMISPRKAKIEILALGDSVSTPVFGIQAEVLVVHSFEELDQPDVSKKAKGKIVVYNFDFVSYQVSVKYRNGGAAQAARYGAIAVLIRSVTPFSLYTLHTGQQYYEDYVTKIPTASITVEDAKMLQRYQNSGEKIMLNLKIFAKNLPNVTSRNIVAELKGTTSPKKVVIVSGHIDSWDVGVGAMDDGGGAFISWYALVVLKSLNLQPRRTLRAVLWTSEENGYHGFFGYNEAHKDELDNITFAFESDEGTFTPLGIEYTTGKKGGCILQEIVNLMEPINATQTKASSAVGSDISFWAGKIPTGSLLNANDRYFWYHHTQADTMDVLDPNTLDKATALWAAVSYVIADLSIEFPRDFD